MATALKGHPALGSWEIVNELEGSVYNGKMDPNKCYDTQVLIGSGAGWTGKWIPMQRLFLIFAAKLKFVKILFEYKAFTK